MFLYEQDFKNVRFVLSVTAYIQIIVYQFAIMNNALEEGLFAIIAQLSVTLPTLRYVQRLCTTLLSYLSQSSLSLNICILTAGVLIAAISSEVNWYINSYILILLFICLLITNTERQRTG